MDVFITLAKMIEELPCPEGRTPLLAGLELLAKHGEIRLNHDEEYGWSLSVETENGVEGSSQPYSRLIECVLNCYHNICATEEMEKGVD